MSKRPLRSTLEELAANFADAAIAAARELLFEYAKSQRQPDSLSQSQSHSQSRARGRAVAASESPANAATTKSPSARKTRGVKPSRAAGKRESVAPEVGGSSASELLITDPLALLAALETADAPAAAAMESYGTRASRKTPEILKPVESSIAEETPVVASVPIRTPALREGEVIVRRSAGGVVLRRRRA